MATLKVTNIRNESFAGDQLYLKTDGKIGIGTTAPDQMLHIKGDTPYIKFEDDNDNQDWQIEARAFFSIYDVNDSAHRLVIDGSGNIGIGTTSPTSLLEVVGTTGANVLINAATHNAGTANQARLQLGFVHSGGQALAHLKLDEAANNSFDGLLKIGVPYNNGSGGSTTREVIEADFNGNICIPGSTVTWDTTARTNGLQLYYETDTGLATIGSYSSGGSTSLIFATNSSGGAAAERLRIDSSGDVIIGSTSSTTVSGAGTPLQVSGSDAYTGMSIIRTASAGAQFQFASGSSGDNVSDNDALGYFKFFGYHTNGYDEYARIHGEVDGTPGDGDAPGALVFNTTADGASSPSERMRIASSGNVTISSAKNSAVELRIENTNNTQNAAIAKLSIHGGDAANQGPIIELDRNGAVHQLQEDASGNLTFTDNGTIKYVMEADGDLQITDGNLWVAAGHGIDFSHTSDGTGATSELFDDYEEGLHTCTATPQNGTVTLLSGINTLAYTKVGRIVHVGGTVKVDSVSNPSGDMQLSMPFTVNDLTEQAGRTAGASFVHNSTDGNNDQVWAVWINEGTNDIWLRMPGTSGSANKVQANTEFFISISYPI